MENFLEEGGLMHLKESLEGKCYAYKINSAKCVQEHNIHD